VYPFIEAEQAGKHNVNRACELLKVSRSAYYQHARSEQSLRACVDEELTAKIRAVHAASNGTYGAPRSMPNSPRPDCGTAVSALPG